MRVLRSLLVSLPVFAVLGVLFWTVAHDGRWPWQPEPVHGPDWCEAHASPKATCEKCKPALARGGTTVLKEREPKEGECPNTLVRITLGPGVAEKAGIEVAEVVSRPVSEAVTANAETRYDPATYARVAPRLSGVVKEVRATLGKSVEKGETLAVIESLDLAQSKADLVHARAVLDVKEKVVERLTPFVDQKLIPPKDLLTAEQEVVEARLEVARATQHLLVLGIPKEKIDAIGPNEPAQSLTEVTAPFSGIVLEASAVIGETAGPDRPLFAVADVSRLWLRIDVPEEAAPEVSAGQRVTFTTTGLLGKKFPGKVLTLGSEVDDKARTVPVIAEVKNSGGLLRANLFGTAEIRVKTTEAKVLVPKEALQNDGDCWLVFKSPLPGVFQARKVEIGTAYRDGYEVVGGLVAGEKVATTGSFLLKTEVLRGQMGAG